MTVDMIGHVVDVVGVCVRRVGWGRVGDGWGIVPQVQTHVHRNVI